MPIKLSDALQGMKARIADLESINPSFDIQPTTSESIISAARAQDATLGDLGTGPNPRLPAESNANQPFASSTIVLKLSEIQVGADRIRQYFDSEKTASLVQSIQRYGFRGVLWVRLNQGQYHLVAGGRRYAACLQAGIQEVPVELWEINDAEAIQLELLENFQREDLNPIEETEGVLRMLEVSLNLHRSEIIGLLHRKSRQQREAGFELAAADTGVRTSTILNTAEPDQQASNWQTIEDLFKVIGRFSPESFRTHRLPLLNLPEPLVAVIQTGQLEYSKARLIARIKDTATRTELLNQAIAANWSRQQINQRIRELTASPSSNQPQTEQTEFQTRVRTVLKQLESVTLSGRTLKKAGKLLAELEALLN